MHHLELCGCGGGDGPQPGGSPPHVSAGDQRGADQGGGGAEAAGGGVGGLSPQGEPRGWQKGGAVAGPTPFCVNPAGPAGVASGVSPPQTVNAAPPA